MFCQPGLASKTVIWLIFWRLEACVFASLSLSLRLFTFLADVGLQAMVGDGFTGTREGLVQYMVVGI